MDRGLVVVGRVIGRVVIGRVIGQVDFAVAAVAAATASLTQMISACILRALYADMDRFLLADGAMKRRGNIHGVFLTG